MGASWTLDDAELLKYVLNLNTPVHLNGIDPAVC
jgi:hypothetical protein